MANIKISDLPPATLPLDNDNTLLETTVLEAGQEVSRRVNVTDLITAISGLDATFLTVSLNANLPNERVLTAGTNVSLVDSGPNGTLTINVTGGGFGDVFKVGTPVDNQLGVWTGDGTIEGDANLTWNGSVLGLNGNLDFLGAAMPLIRAVSTDSTTPNIHVDRGDIDTGLGDSGGDSLSVITGGVEAQRWSEFNNDVLQMHQILTPLSAAGGGGQGPATVLESSYNVITLVGSAGDSVKLAGNNLKGTVTYIKNDGLNAVDVFPATGDDLGQGTNVAESLAAGFTVVYQSVSLTTWTVLLRTTNSVAGADVFKVGTPVDNQVGVWTGDGTLEGNDNFLWDGVVLSTFDAGTTDGLSQGHDGLKYEFSFSASNSVDFFGTTSSYQFDRTVSIGGIGGFGSQGLFIDDTSGVSVGIQLRTSGLNQSGAGIGAFSFSGMTQLIVGLTGTAALPAIAFGDGDTGFLEALDDNLGVSVAGTQRFFWELDSFNANAGTGPAMLNVASGAAIPTLVPRRSDSDTGLGSAGGDLLSLIAGGVQIAQAVESIGANQFVVAPGAVQNNVSAPDLGFGDGDTGVMQTVDDTIALVAGANLAVRYAEASGSVVQTNNSNVALTASVTQTQVGGLALLSSYNEVSTVANEGDALTAFDVFQGSRLVVVNNGANGLQLFPASGDNFGAGVDAPVTISANSVGVFLGRDSTNWDPLQNQSASGSVFQGLGIWRYRTEITSPPATGQVRFNNADPTLATEMFLAETNSNGTDVNNFLNLMTPGSVFYIQDKSNAANFFLVEISSNTDNGTDRTFGIANITLQGVEPTQNAEVLIIASEAGPVPTVNDAVQARRTTGYVLTTAFVDVTLDVTDVETDDAVLNHDLVTNTDNIIAVVAGTYAISYQFNISNASVVNTIIEAQARVRLNDAGTGISGSLASTFNMRNHGTQLPTHLSCDFIVTLAASDFITLQAQKIELDDVQVYTIDEVSVKATRLL